MPLSLPATLKALDEATAKPGKQLPRLVLMATTASDAIAFSAAGGVSKLPLEGDEAVEHSENKASPDSVFWLASATKVVTSIAALQLVEQGLVDLDAPASTYVPELDGKEVFTAFSDAGEPQFEAATQQPTLRHLLTHSGGFGYPFNTPDEFPLREKLGLPSPFGAVTKLATTGMPFVYQPGTSFRYSSCTDWAGFVVENVSGLSLEDYFQRHIFAPLGIKDISFVLTDSLSSRLVTLANRKPDRVPNESPFVPESYYEPSAPLLATGKPECCSGGGGLWGSPKSYLKILRLLLTEGKDIETGAQVLKPETVELLFTPQFAGGPAEEEKLLRLNEMLRREQDPFSRSIETGRREGEEDPEVKKDWGLAGAVYQGNLISGRGEGSLTWSGVANTHWVADREKGVAFLVWANVLPVWDPEVFDVWRTFETELYEAL